MTEVMKVTGTAAAMTTAFVFWMAAVVMTTAHMPWGM